MKNSNFNQDEGLVGDDLDEAAMSVDDIQRDLMHQGGAKRKARKMTSTLDMDEMPKKGSKKGSKKASKKTSKKGSKKTSKKASSKRKSKQTGGEEELVGGKRRSKKTSKKASKKTSTKKTSKKRSKQTGGEEELVGGKKRSKKASKKGSKKKSRKGSKQSRMMVPMVGGKKRSKSSSKSSSKKVSKKRSSQKRTLHPALAENIKTNKIISEKVGYNISPALITYIARKFGDSAKASVKDPKDYKAINKKKLEIFEDYLAKNSKSKLVSEIVKVGEDLKEARKKNSKK